MIIHEASYILFPQLPYVYFPLGSGFVSNKDLGDAIIDRLSLEISASEASSSVIESVAFDFGEFVSAGSSSRDLEADFVFVQVGRLKTPFRIIGRNTSPVSTESSSDARLKNRRSSYFWVINQRQMVVNMNETQSADTWAIPIVLILMLDFPPFLSCLNLRAQRVVSMIIKGACMPIRIQIFFDRWARWST
jgi:hypothetical protein